MQYSSDLNGDRLMMAQRRHFDFAPDDRISNLPASVITNIVNRIPMQDTVRIGILSKCWSYNRLLLSQIVFDENFVRYLHTKKAIYRFYTRHIGGVILGCRGNVTKFVLYIPNACNDYNLRLKEYERICGVIKSCINTWIAHFSDIGLHELVVINMGDEPLMLKPTISFFETITDLELRNCTLNLPSRFCFPRLLRLKCDDLSFGRRRFGGFICKCPLLEDLRIGDKIADDVTVDEIERLKELKIFHLYLHKLYQEMVSSSALFTLLQSFPKLEEVHLDFLNCKVSFRERIPATFSCLNSLSLGGIDFTNSREILCVCDLISCSPHLQNLSIRASYDDKVDEDSDSLDSTEVESVIMGRLQKLRSVKLEHFRGSKNELCFIKHLLGHALSLEKMVVLKNTLVPSIEDKILEFHQVSLIAKIEFH